MNILRIIATLMLLLGSAAALADDWPMYKADAQRSSVSRENIATPLAERWVYQPSQPPRPAWPDPKKEHHRVDFDAAPQPVAADGIVYFGSSADDTLRAIDVESGEILWTFTAGGPIRFAPAIAEGKAYVAADDGWLVCLDAKTGRIAWRFHAAQRNAQLLGNGRIISRRPLRSGVLVEHGTVYLTAGVWPSEGVLVFALDSASGKVKWCNDTSDTLYLAQPHASAFALTGVAPQGYLLATREQLIVPTGRGVPAAFNRQTGALEFFKPSDSKTHGGCWATVAGGRLFNGGLVYELPSGNQIDCPTTKVPYWAKQDFDFGTRKHVLGYRGRRVLATEQQVLGRREGHCVALAGKVLFEGGDGAVQAFDTTSKNAETVLWEAALEGRVHGLAISDGKVFAATDRGTIHCFGEKLTPDRRIVRDPQPPRDQSDNSMDPRYLAAARLAGESGITMGYALVVGDRDGQLAMALASQTELHVLSLAGNARELQTQRANLLQAGIYGSRVAAQSIERLLEGDLPPYFANLIVVADVPEGLSGETLWRVLRPCGGVLCFVDCKPSDIERLASAAAEPPENEQQDRPLHWFRRGKLPGAFDWDSQNPTDERLRWPLELLWFGGPGPARMQDRHRAWIAPPVAADGRYFVPGERHVIAVDAYNGTELWSWQFTDEDPAKRNKEIQLKGLSADDDFAYFNLGEGWVRLDAQTGKPAGTLAALPAGRHEWGRLPRREVSVPLPLRTHALTAENVPRTYYRAYGCNQLMCSSGLDFFRSGTLGLYDMEDDSGLRNIGAFRPGCWRSHNAALGIFISSEGASGCKCSYNFQTSLALVPAQARRNEDWAVYYDLPTDGLVRRAAVNLGAPGDRRGEAKKLWLGFPRPNEPIVFQMPISVEVAVGAGLGRYHYDADRRKVHSTDQPWIYTTGYRGLRRLKLLLDKQQPVISQDHAAPQLDGRFADAEWSDTPARILHPVENRQVRGAPNRRLIDPKKWQSELYFAHDADHLYVAFTQPNRVDRKGKPYAWRKTAVGKNAPVWRDDSVELFVSDEARQTVLHFGVSASAATYDAKCELASQEREDARWDAAWQSAVSADDAAFIVELAIPWATLSAAGLSKDRLMINAQTYTAGWYSPLRFLGSAGRLRCENFAPLGLGESPKTAQRAFRVRLHFAEPDQVPAGTRRFDVKLQGRTVLSQFDVVEAAGASNTAVVRQFDNVAAGESILLELAPSAANPGAHSETILSGLEIEEVNGPEPTPNRD